MAEVNRFLVRMKDGRPDVPSGLKIIDWFQRSTDYAEVLVDERGAKYLSRRKYALPANLPNTHISVSAVSTYLRCPLQYYWRYVHGLKIPPKSEQAFGTATHRTIATNFRQKIDTHEDYGPEDFAGIWATEFRNLIPEIQWEEGEKPDEIVDEGVAIARLYAQQVSPTIQPMLVEHEVNVELPSIGTTLKGVIDVLDDSGSIIDTKTTKRTPQEDAIKHDLQMTTYSLLHRIELASQEKQLRMDYLVRTKTPKVIILRDEPRSEQAIQRLLRMYSAVCQAIRSGSYWPNPHNFMCNPNGCGYWEICQKEW